MYGSGSVLLQTQWSQLLPGSHAGHASAGCVACVACSQRCQLLQAVPQALLYEASGALMYQHRHQLQATCPVPRSSLGFSRSETSTIPWQAVGYWCVLAQWCWLQPQASLLRLGPSWRPLAAVAACPHQQLVIMRACKVSHAWIEQAFLGLYACSIQACIQPQKGLLSVSCHARQEGGLCHRSGLLPGHRPDPADCLLTRTADPALPYALRLPTSQPQHLSPHHTPTLPAHPVPRTGAAFLGPSMPQPSALQCHCH